MNIGRASRLLTAGVALLLMGCTLVTPENGASSPAFAAAPPPSTPSKGVSVSFIPGDLLNAILDDASQRTGLAADALVVTRAEATTWNDGSLGCPEPGMFYTQALVDGYQIVIDAEGQQLDYRAGKNLDFRLCDQ